MMEAGVYKKVLKAYRKELLAAYTNKNCCEEMEGKNKCYKDRDSARFMESQVEISTEVIAKSF